MLLNRFNVKEADNIDIPRISEENKDIEALTVIIGNSSEVLFLLHNNFLKKFTTNDDLMVNNDILNPKWGSDAYIVTQYRNDSVHCYYDSSTKKLVHHRGKIVNIDKINEVEKQLKVARNYKRSFEVKVHSL